MVSRYISRTHEIHEPLNISEQQWPWSPMTLSTRRISNSPSQGYSQTVQLHIYILYIYTKIYIVYTGFCLEDVDVKKNILDESISGRFLKFTANKIYNNFS